MEFLPQNSRTPRSSNHCQTNNKLLFALLFDHPSWLDSVGTPVGVQQRLMRHADIRTTMNIYGDAATPDMREASGKIAMLALNGR